MSVCVPIADLQRFVEACLVSVGMNAVPAKQTAETLTLTDSMGVFTHGSKLLVGYLKKLRGGGYQPQATPQIERQGPSWAIVDGASALGQVGSRFAMELAMEKARQTGVAYVGLRNTGHIGAAGAYAAMAARAGFISMITGNDMPSVAAPGSRSAVLGSNPLAYGVPVFDGDPILLDIATAAVAGGKVYAAHQRGEPIPPTWLIDKAGQPTTDGSLYPANASLAPMAGHKGYGLGLWCEIMSGVLPGGHLMWQVGSWIFDPPTQPSWHNASFMVMDVNTLVPRDEYTQRLKYVIDQIHAAPTADGVDRVLLPGEREWTQYRTAQQHGIPLPADVVAKLKECAELTGVSLPI